MVSRLAVPFITLALVVFADVADAGQNAWSHDSHVRPSSERIELLLVAGGSRSETFRTLVGALDDSEWIVFVQEGRCPIRSLSACLLHYVGTFRGARYLRILVDARGEHSDRLIATIAHELQHAFEVASAGYVSAPEQFQFLFRHIGYPALEDPRFVAYETRRARVIEEQARRELRDRRSLETAGR